MAKILNAMVAMDIFQSRMTDVEFDVCEIAGGQARTSTILAKCRVRVGKNFDLCTGSELTEISEQKAFLRYRAARR
eukprot:6896218-Pyramimonas_sp.AAC.1